MRHSFVAAAILAAALVTAAPARAQNYPWCAHINAGADEALNCGFVSFEQCMATVRGMGGFCMANNTYRAPLPAAGPARRSPRHATRKPS
jgi:hypothetical protein